MSKARTLARAAFQARQKQAEIASSAIVIGCAAALILAGLPAPLAL